MISRLTRKVCTSCAQALTVSPPLTAKAFRSMNVVGMERTEPSGLRLWSVGLGLISALLGVSACGGNDLLLPQDGEPSRVIAFRGNDQTAVVGQPLQDSLVVEVTDPA